MIFENHHTIRDGDKGLVLGIEHAYGGARRSLTIPGSTLLRHGFIVGQTGVGKTTLLLNLLGQLVEAGEGIGFIDPHGAAAGELLDLIPRRRTRSVIHLKASDIGRPISLNPLAGVRTDAHHRTASAVGEAVRAVHADSWGDRLDWILYNSLRALLYVPGATVLDVPRLLVDDQFRHTTVGRIEDAAVRSFWLDEFAAYDRAFRTVAVAPVQNKMGKLRAHPPLRAILGDPCPRLSLDAVLARGQILIADLSGIGESSANLLGSILVSSLFSAALDRGSTPTPKPFTLVIDEAHRFTTESIASVLSEARKYGLGIVLADQFLDQTPVRVQNALFGNAGTLMSFRVSGPDAERLALHFGLGTTPESLTDLEPFGAVVRSLDGSATLGPLKLTTLPLWVPEHNRGAVIRAESARRFGSRA